MDRRLWLLMATRLVVTAGFAAVMPFLAMHLAAERGVPLLQIGGMWLAVGLCSAGASWVAGVATDRVGRRPLLLGAMMLRSLNLFLIGYAIHVRAPFPAIVALAMVNAASRAFYDPIAHAVVAALAPPEQRVAAFSLHRVGSSIGWALGPIAAALGARLPYATLFYLAAPLTLLAAVPAAFIPETRPASPGPRRRLADMTPFLRHGGFVRFLLATFAFYLLQTQLYHMLPIHAAKNLGLERAQVGTLFAINGVLVVLLQLPAIRLIRAGGTSGTLVAGAITYLLGYAGVAFAPSYLPLLACVALLTLAEIVSVPAQQTATANMAPPHAVGVYAGFSGVAQGAGQTVGPVLGTVLSTALSAQAMWLIMAGVALLAAYAFAPAGPGFHRQLRHDPGSGPRTG